MTQPHYIDREAVALLPCPHCGPSGEPVMKSGHARYWVICEECGSRSDDFLTAEVAAGAWNRRPAPMEAVAWREKVARIIDPAAFLFGPDELDAKVYSASRAHAFDRADAILQALAVIPTEGGGDT